MTGRNSSRGPDGPNSLLRTTFARLRPALRPRPSRAVVVQMRPALHTNPVNAIQPAPNGVSEKRCCLETARPTATQRRSAL